MSNLEPEGTIQLPEVLDLGWAEEFGPRLTEQIQRQNLTLDAKAVLQLESPAAAVLHRLRKSAALSGKHLILASPSESFLAHLTFLDPGEDTPPKSGPTPLWIDRLGESAWNGLGGLLEALRFASGVFTQLPRFLLKRGSSWPGGTWRQLHELGAQSTGVVLLLTLLIGFTLALLMGQQLSQYGASIHLATLMGIAFTREVGPLLTAVIVAGRSGSAVAAELATMAVQEETDALQTMGADQAAFLIWPRALALIFSLPALTLFASAAGCTSGLLAGWMSIDLDPRLYLQVLSDAVSMGDIGFGLTKSVVFAILIAFIACRVGLSAKGGSDAVGASATRTVVSCIVWVVVADCGFALWAYL